MRKTRERDATNKVEHVFGADKDDNDGEKLPRDEGDSETDEGTDTETGDGADGDLDESGEGKTDVRMDGGHATHGEGDVEGS